ncbi:glycoside hydrolase family 3 protein [Xylaria bambusicola]|uniref:glycoside hydrolase family 3 protein n=1 Tax=Xylaria bambusicola TaxID=326684 RepID=UPI002007662A|nr:glycoside hydrolase family 3 protein [Xylaria bambusicola]KAI0509153.1 glycoside hydrolase family 3 protein [Xylaria bambusicola]
MAPFSLFLTIANLLGSTLAITAADAASHVIFSYPGTAHPARLTTLAKKCQIGGVIIFRDNVDSKLPAYLAGLQSAYASGGCTVKGPLLILTDQEGGQVKRLPGGPTLSEKMIGQQSNLAAAGNTAGVQAANALKAYNNNGNLAPVLDVYHAEGDFEDQFERSYSNDPAVVAACASAFIKAQQGLGIAATAKHFPGLGAASASENTDARPVTITRSLADLRSIDEAPYAAAIQAGVKMIMPSWALYPALDSEYPSGISSKWLQGELRGRLGFEGVIITDAIEAGGLSGFGTDSQRSVLALRAGVDIILAAARDVSQGEGIVSALVNAVNSGSLSSSAFSASTARISALRNAL